MGRGGGFSDKPGGVGVFGQTGRGRAESGFRTYWRGGEILEFEAIKSPNSLNSGRGEWDENAVGSGAWTGFSLGI
jgi:hypothetical protein